MKIDYSPKAISRRLRAVDELRNLCRALAGPRWKAPELRHAKECKKERIVSENRSAANFK